VKRAGPSAAGVIRPILEPEAGLVISQAFAPSTAITTPTG